MLNVKGATVSSLDGMFAIRLATCLTVDEVVWSKKGPDTASSNTVHCSGLQVNKQGPGDIFSTYKHKVEVYYHQSWKLTF